MTHSDDLTPYHSYSGDEFRFCGLPLLQVGWLEPPHAFPTGKAPIGFPERLLAFCAWDKIVELTCGHQDCAFCGATYYQQWTQYNSPLGNGEIRVLGDGVVYAAPSLIYHYVAVHAYVPPPGFIAAVMEGPAPDTRSLLRYRFRFWEATIYSALYGSRGSAPLKAFPPAKPGAVLGPLIWRYRAIAILGILLVAVLLAQPGGVGVSTIIVLTLAAAASILRAQLTCPVCKKRLRLMLREPRGWSLPPDGPFATMYCYDCGVGYRPTPDLWGEPLAEVATTWR
jgi:hypothetical protein